MSPLAVRTVTLLSYLLSSHSAQHRSQSPAEVLQLLDTLDTTPIYGVFGDCSTPIADMTGFAQMLWLPAEAELERHQAVAEALV